MLLDKLKEFFVSSLTIIYSSFTYLYSQIISHRENNHLIQEGPAPAFPIKLNIINNLKIIDEFKDNTPIHFAVIDSNLHEIKTLLNNDPSLINCINGSGFSPLHIAVVLNRITIAEFLLEKGANPNDMVEGYSTPRTVLTTALYYKHFEMTKLLMQYGCNLRSEWGVKIGEAVFVVDKALMGLMKLENYYRNYGLNKVSSEDEITEPMIKDFVKWKAEAKIPYFIKHDISLLSEYIQKLLILNKLLEDEIGEDNTPFSPEIKKLLEEKIQSYIGNQYLVGTNKPILNLQEEQEFREAIIKLSGDQQENEIYD